MSTPTEAHEKLYNEIFKLVGRELFEDYAESSTGPATQLIADSEARATAELRGALALGQQNCDDAYDDLRTERDAAIARAERAEAEIIRLRTENSDLKATDTRPLLTGKLTHAGLCRIDGELVDGVFIAVYREQIKACRRLPMYQEIELRIVAYK